MQHKGVFSWRFDGAYDSQYDVALPILSAHGQVGTLYLVEARVDGSGGLTTAEVNSFASAGWEIAQHSGDIPYLDELSTSAVISKLSADKTLLEGRGWTINGVAPLGRRTDEEARAGVETLYSHYNTGSDVLAEFPKTLTGFDPFDIMGCPSSMSSTSTVAYYTDLIDLLVEKGGYMSFLLHQAANTPTLAQHMKAADLATIAAYLQTYIDSGDIVNVNTSDLVSMATDDAIMYVTEGTRQCGIYRAYTGRRFSLNGSTYYRESGGVLTPTSPVGLTAYI